MTRLELQELLEELFESRNVYYQPPETLKMEYPCIRYSKKSIEGTFADSVKYLKNKSYELMVIDKRPDNPVIDKLLELQYCSYDRHYTSDGLNHDVLTIFI